MVYYITIFSQFYLEKWSNYKHEIRICSTPHLAAAAARLGHVQTSGEIVKVKFLAKLSDTEKVTYSFKFALGMYLNLS